MTLRYTPDERAVQIAEKALSMKVSIEGVIASIQEQRQEYMQRLESVLDAAEETILGYSTDDSTDDQDLDYAQRDQEVLGDFQPTLNEMHDSKVRSLQSMAHRIDQRQLSTLPMKELLEDAEAGEDRVDAFRIIIDTAVSQAFELLNFDVYQDALLRQEAIDIVMDHFENKSS